MIVRSIAIWSVHDRSFLRLYWFVFKILVYCRFQSVQTISLLAKFNDGEILKTTVNPQGLGTLDASEAWLMVSQFQVNWCFQTLQYHSVKDRSSNWQKCDPSGVGTQTEVSHSWTAWSNGPRPICWNLLFFPDLPKQTVEQSRGLISVPQLGSRLVLVLNGVVRGSNFYKIDNICFLICSLFNHKCATQPKRPVYYIHDQQKSTLIPSEEKVRTGFPNYLALVFRSRG